jgi:putative transcriptional regulator
MLDRAEGRAYTYIKVGGNMEKEQITAIRARLKMTQGTFALALGVSRRTVENWEQGLRRPSTENEAKIDALRRK